MMRYKFIGFSILFLSSIAFTTEEETKEAAKTWDDYKIIAERNIFSRYRTKALPFSEVRQPVVVPEESYFTLRGITKESNGYVSFIEDSRTMGITRLRKGDSIAEGRITGITLDYLYYENEGKTEKVEIGMNLEGQVVSSGMKYASSGFESSQVQRNSRFSETEKSQGMGQFPSIDQMPGMDQSQGGRGQMPGMDQSQSIVQSSSAGQPSTAQTQAITGTQQQGASSDDIIQRLKERRKKELE